jgi:hypothetical protein
MIMLNASHSSTERTLLSTPTTASLNSSELLGTSNCMSDGSSSRKLPTKRFDQELENQKHLGEGDDMTRPRFMERDQFLARQVSDKFCIMNLLDSSTFYSKDLTRELQRHDATTRYVEENSYKLPSLLEENYEDKESRNEISQTDVGSLASALKSSDSYELKIDKIKLGKNIDSTKKKRISKKTSIDHEISKDSIPDMENRIKKDKKDKKSKKSDKKEESKKGKKEKKKKKKEKAERRDSKMSKSSASDQSSSGGFQSSFTIPQELLGHLAEDEMSMESLFLDTSLPLKMGTEIGINIEKSSIQVPQFSESQRSLTLPLAPLRASDKSISNPYEDVISSKADMPHGFMSEFANFHSSTVSSVTMTPQDLTKDNSEAAPDQWLSRAEDGSSYSSTAFVKVKRTKLKASEFENSESNDFWDDAFDNDAADSNAWDTSVPDLFPQQTKKQGKSQMPEDITSSLSFQANAQSIFSQLYRNEQMPRDFSIEESRNKNLSEMMGSKLKSPHASPRISRNREGPKVKRNSITSESSASMTSSMHSTGHRASCSISIASYASNSTDVSRSMAESSSSFSAAPKASRKQEKRFNSSITTFDSRSITGTIKSGIESSASSNSGLKQPYSVPLKGNESSSISSSVGYQEQIQGKHSILSVTGNLSQPTSQKNSKKIVRGILKNPTKAINDDSVSEFQNSSLSPLPSSSNSGLLKLAKEKYLNRKKHAAF